MNTREVVAKLLKKYEDGTVSVIDDFLEGHCHEFALALNKVFGYKLGLIKSRYTAKDDKERKVLLHAFALDSKGQAFDVEGKYSVSDAIKGYTTQKNPTTGEVLKNVSYNVYDSPKKFKSKLWTIPIDQNYMDKAIKKITKNPLDYFKGSNIVKVPPLKFKTLETNDKWSWDNDSAYKYKQEKKFDKKIEQSLKKSFGTLDGKWVITDAHFVWKGLAIGLGLGTYDFDLIDNKIVSIDNKINDKLSDEDSKKNIDDYMKDLTDFVTTSPKIKEWFKKTLKIKEGALSMKRESLIKKALFKLTANKFDKLRKEFLEYLKTDAKEIFEFDDVKVDARIDYIMDGKDVEDINISDVEFGGASIKGLSTLLHDLYMDANNNEKPEDEMCKEYGTMLHKDLVGKEFPFKSKVERGDQENDVEGTIKIKGTKYDAVKDVIEITDAEIDNFEVD